MKPALLFVLFIAIPLQGLSFTQPDDSDDPPKVGLVLSGGGAKGIAHIGILEALEEAGVRIDYITGTSMGSLVGSLYSIGYTTDQLIEIAESNAWEEMFAERADRRLVSNYQREFEERTIASFPIRDRALDLPFGVISGQNIYSFFSELMWPSLTYTDFSEFPIPFATTGTDLETGESKLFTSGYLPDAVRASISIPSLMRPHKIDGISYIDGGLSNNLPVEEVKAMGADYVISVNVAMEPMSQDSVQSLAAVVNQLVNFQVNRNLESKIDQSDIYIKPEGIDELDMFAFDKVAELLAIGRDAGREFFENFKSLAEKQSKDPIDRPSIDKLDPVSFQEISITGNNDIDSGFIRDELQLESGTPLTPEIINERINQLYSTQLFDLIYYRILPHDQEGYNLQIKVSENRTDVLRVGLRYETETQASILLGAQFRNLLHSSSITRLDLRLGNEIRFLTDHLLFGALGSQYGLRTSLRYEGEDIDVYEGEDIAGRFNNNLLRAELSMGNFLSRSNFISMGVRQDFLYHRNLINPETIPVLDQNHHSIYGQFKIDQLNRISYPTNGHHLVADITYTSSLIFSPLDYTRLSFFWNGVFPIGESVSLHSKLLAGYTGGSDRTWDNLYSVNRLDPDFGFVRFGGFQRYELSASNIQMASLGVQFEPFYHRFFNVDVYTGRFLDEWDVDVSTDSIDWGVSLSAGALTILGPVQAIFSTGNRHNFLAELQIGYQF